MTTTSSLAGKDELRKEDTVVMDLLELRKRGVTVTWTFSLRVLVEEIMEADVSSRTGARNP